MRTSRQSETASSRCCYSRVPEHDRSTVTNPPVDIPGAVILDVDGTLVDSNYQHALAWYEAFRQHGMRFALCEIHHHIGMGGDQLITALAGQRAEREHGDSLRATHDALYLASMRTVSALAGARDLLVELKAAGRRVVLASSAGQDEVDFYLDLLDARTIVDGWTTSKDVDSTKPEPDLIQVALKKLGTSDAVMVGDTPWDVRAAANAGIETIAVLTGGFAREALEDAGAVAVLRSVEQLRESLESRGYPAMVSASRDLGNPGKAF